MSSIPKLVLWFDELPRVNDGIFKKMADQWGNEVILICNQPLRDERLKWGWNIPELGKIKIVYTSKIDDFNEYLKVLVLENKDAIHIFNGFKSKISKYIPVYISYTDSPKILIMSERHGVYGPIIKKFFKSVYNPIIYRWYFLRFNKHVTSLLPLGEKGIKTFRKNGWNESKMYPFMYSPHSEILDQTYKTTDQKVKFVYVGRFSKYTKGTDYLREAIEKLDIGTEDWSIDLVGGYGDDADTMISWANTKDNISFIGKWDSDKIVENLQNYDVALVPSKFDGWNVVINETINAGLAVITTDEAVSNELVSYAKNGIEASSKSSSEFANAIAHLVKNKNELNNMKQNSIEYAEKISSESISKYLIEIINYEFKLTKENTRPTPPWKQ